VAIPSQTTSTVSGRLGKGVHVTVIDTGYTRGIHPYMDSRIASTGTPELDAQSKDGVIDFEAGHSTFVSGMILRRAPQAEIDVVEVLGPAGFGTEHDIARASVARGSSNIINLSLGGHSDDDQPPVALDAALRRVRPATRGGRRSRQQWLGAANVAGRVQARPRCRCARRDGRARIVQQLRRVGRCVHRRREHRRPVPAVPPGGRDTGVRRLGDLEWYAALPAPKVSGEIAARLSTRRFGTARDAAASLVNDPTRPYLPVLALERSGRNDLSDRPEGHERGA
jgi:subtilase family protein